jgi:CRISPR-associated protein Cas6
VGRAPAGLTAVSPADAPAHVDLAFAVSGGPLPRDHSFALWAALAAAVPTLAEGETLAVFPVRAADAGNGRLVLQRHSRLLLRMPESQVDAALALCGRQVEIEGAPLALGAARSRPLAHHATLYAHRVAAEHDDEAAFVLQATRDLERLGVRTEFIVGRRTRTRGPEGTLAGFSLMLANLAPRESLALQATGLGAHRRLGFGIFVGHK